MCDPYIQTYVECHSLLVSNVILLRSHGIDYILPVIR